MNYFFCVVGLVLIIEGLPYFISPDGMKRMLVLLPQIPSRHLRLLGACAMICGLLLVYIARTRLL